MKKQDIRNAYTQKVTELLNQGYTIFPDTMNGSQGEIAHIDLTNGSEIIRVLLERGLCWSHISDGFHGDVVTLTIGRAAADTWVGDRWDGTIWNSRLEPSFQIKWAEVNGRGEGWYINLDESASIGRIQMERYRASHTDRREALGDAFKSTALRWLRKQPKMKTEAELSETNRQLRTAQSAWTAAGKALTEFGDRCQKIGKSAEQLGKTLTRTVTTPIVGLGTAAVKASLDFESSFAYVRKTVNGTEADFDTLAAASKRMSTEIATSTDEINKVMATGGQLGIATEHIEEFARVMIDLSNASTDLDADTAATQLAKFANIMGTSQSQFSNIGSTIAMLGNNFATTEAPIAEMAMRIAGAGKQVGLTEAQVLGLATALSSVGIQAQAGGSSISKALINMEVAATTGGDALTDFARVCGITEKQFVEQWKSDPIRVFQLFIERLSQMSDEGIGAVATLDEIGISEIRLRDTMLRAVNATELFANAQNMAVQAWEENTALADKANVRYNTTASKLTNLKNKAVLFAQTLGDDLRPTLDKIIEGVNGFIDKLGGLDSAQRQQIIRIAAIAAATGPLILLSARSPG